MDRTAEERTDRIQMLFTWNRLGRTWQICPNSWLSPLMQTRVWIFTTWCRGWESAYENGFAKTSAPLGDLLD